MGLEEDDKVVRNDRGGARRRLFVFALALAVAISALPAGAGRGTTTAAARPSLIQQLITLNWLYGLLFPWATTTTTAPTTTAVPTSTSAPTTTSPTTTSPTTTTPPGEEPVEGCGDEVLLKADGTPWECSFADHFSGDELDRDKWLVQETAMSGYTSGGECYLDRPENVDVADGRLVLTARRGPAVACRIGLLTIPTPFTGGMVSTKDRFSQTYGRFEVRASLPTTTRRGIQTAFWLWPNDSTRYGAWPRSGEIDFMEWYSEYRTRVIPVVHYRGDADDPDATNTECFVDDVSQPHTYVVEWTPESIKVLIDGVVCIDDHWDPDAPLVKPQPFDQPFFLSLTQAIGINTNRPIQLTEFPATTYVDHVRVWR